MPNIILGVSGSIAAYRAADVARELMRHGCTVRVCLTSAAEKFVTRVLFESLTGQPCLVWAFDEPVTGRMAHIDWAKEADLLLVAPATANILCKFAHGFADDMLSTLGLAYTGPVVFAPAMNPAMYAAEATQKAIRMLKDRGASFIDPAEGDVACGEHGQGKLASVQDIARAAMEALRRSDSLKGRRVLITSGPTREPIDDVRYLSNRSSGLMGAAVARAALLKGAHVVVVAGPSSASMPYGAEVRTVLTAQEMLDAALAEVGTADLVIGAAAVADYRPTHRTHGKVRRGEGSVALQLTPNPDVIAELARAAKPGAQVVGFAAEPDSSLETARDKLARKGLFAIAVNDVSRPDIGFESAENELTLVFADGRTAGSGLQTKLGCALWLVDQVVG